MKPTLESSYGLAALLLLLLPANVVPAVAAPLDTGGNSVRSPVASALADRVVNAVLGRGGPTSPLPECSADSSLAAGQRVLYNDVQVEGARAAAVPGRGPNCRVTFGGSAGGPISIASTVSFNDAWGPSFSSSGTAAFTNASGRAVRVAQVSLKAMLSVSRYRGFQVVAIPFHDRHYALVLIAGAGLDAATARGYTSGAAFKARQGFEVASVDLAMPKLNFKASASGCDSPCANLRLSRTVSVFFDEYGSGNGGYLPSASSKMNTIPTTYPGNTFGAKVTVRVGQPYYFAIVDVDRQSVLLDAFISHL
jgi:hypothetical protein